MPGGTVVSVVSVVVGEETRLSAVGVKSALDPRWTRYPLISTLSVEAVQVSVTFWPLTVWASPVGTDGAVVSATAWTSWSVKALTLPAASTAAIR